LIKNKIRSDARGVATLVIAIVIVIIIAGAGVTAYVVISNNNNNSSDNSGGGTGGGSGGGSDNPSPSLGGPGFNAGESLTYTLSGGMTGNVDGTAINMDNALSGTITFSSKQESNGDYTVTVAIDILCSMLGVDYPVSTTEKITVSSLDMSEMSTNTADLSSLSGQGYTDQDLQNIQTLLNKYTSEIVTLSTVDGNLTVEKRTYSYNWDDFKSLVPDVSSSLGSIPIDTLNLSMLLWFGKDVLYKTTFTLSMSGDFDGDGTPDSFAYTGSLVLTDHQTA